MESRRCRPAIRCAECRSASAAPAASATTMPARPEAKSPLEPEGHRTIVDELHVHHRAEFSGLYLRPGLAELLDEAIVQRYRDFRPRGSDEARPPPLPRVTVQRELGDHEQRPAHVREREVHLVVGIREEPEADDLFRHPR